MSSSKAGRLSSHTGTHTQTKRYTHIHTHTHTTLAQASRHTAKGAAAPLGR